MGKKYRPEKDDIIKVLIQANGIRKLARAILNVPSSTFKDWLTLYNIDISSYKKVHTRQEIENALSNNRTMREASKSLGIHTNKLMKLADQYKIPRKKRKSRPVVYCKQCGNICNKGRTNRVYCCVLCRDIYKRTTLLNKHTEALQSGSLKSPKILRRLILSTRKHQCSVCKRVTWNRKEIPLWVDHINGNPFDNMPSNLRLICLNCDAQQPTFQSKNRGNGRKLGKDKAA